MWSVTNCKLILILLQKVVCFSLKYKYTYAKYKYTLLLLGRSKQPHNEIILNLIMHPQPLQKWKSIKKGKEIIIITGVDYGG